MSKGKKTSPEIIYRVMAIWSITDSTAETARRMAMPQSTIDYIVKGHKDEPEFVKLCAENRRSFAEKAKACRDKSLKLLENRLDRAIEREEELDTLIDEIFASDNAEISKEDKLMLVKKIKSLQLYDVKSLTTAIGTLYDKMALDEGGATDKVIVEVKLPDEGIDYGR